MPECLQMKDPLHTKNVKEIICSEQIQPEQSSKLLDVVDAKSL
jgi:hypothetical protein